MKKIIAAMDGLKFSESTKNYAVLLAKESSAHLVGVFLDDFTYTSYKIYDLIHEKGGFIGSAQKHLDKKDAKKRATAVQSFEKACQAAGVEYTVHHDKGFALQDLIHESIYADLLIIDSRETISHYNEKPPTEFIRDLLSQVQCPVIVIPHVFKTVNKLVLLYDGEPSSVHAIKMLSYTLPALKTHQAEVVSVKPPKDTLHVPDNKLMKEFMKRHFPKADYAVLKGPAEAEIVSYLKKEKATPLIVLGAYRRSRVSRWFRPSMADLLMRELKFPLFIAHNK